MLGKLNESCTFTKEWLLSIYHDDGSWNYKILINSLEIWVFIVSNSYVQCSDNVNIWPQKEMIYSDNTDRIISGPKNAENVFGDEELIPFCKFCFAKKFKISALNIAETVTTVPESAVIGL